ncbi:MAG: Flp pilus assembly complex ATPase component TadA, partial [Proteobacteria bacterium]|nr:Flp pilus assembly complex ATPase component TadA [Pseudomonadota bacterium]
MTANPRFIEQLEGKGVLTPQDSRALLNKFQDDAMEVLRYLNRGGAAPDLNRLWADSLGLAYVDLNKTLFQAQAVRRIPPDMARKNTVIALYQVGEALTVAMAHPEDRRLLNEIEKIVGLPVSPVFSPPEEIDDAIEIQYQTAGGLSEFISKIAEDSQFKGTTEVTGEQLKQLAQDQSIVELTRGIMLLAVRERASDIHLEPEDARLRVRFRIDGVLQERMKIEKELQAPMTSRLKIMANLDITERRRPQDGRIRLQLSNRDFDFRFSTVPAIYGEKIVMRILGQVQTKEIPALADLGFSSSVYEKTRRIIEIPNGVFFVTGPTGSGKTTTLFAVLQHLNTSGINIMTVEDPVEYRLPG